MQGKLWRLGAWGYPNPHTLSQYNSFNINIKTILQLKSICIKTFLKASIMFDVQYEIITELKIMDTQLNDVTT